MKYKGYIAHVELDDEEGVFHGEVIGTRDVITFEGTSVRQLRKAFHDSVDDYLAFCRQRGEKPETPASGKFVVRIDAADHRRAAMLAKLRGKSLNAFVAECIEKELESVSS